MKQELFILAVPAAAALALMLSTPASAGAESAEKQVARLWYDAFTRHDPALLGSILADDWVDIPSPPEEQAGPVVGKKLLARLTESFPDFKIVVEDLIQEGNKVVVRSRITATQQGAFMGFPASGRSISIQAVDIHEIRDGRIAKTWHTEDWMTGLRQLDLIRSQRG
jgi:steroid delta-isomerase-like uncharacterized protein